MNVQNETLLWQGYKLASEMNVSGAVQSFPAAGKGLGSVLSHEDKQNAGQDRDGASDDSRDTLRAVCFSFISMQKTSC